MNKAEVEHQIHTVCRMRRLSLHTERTYTDWIKRSRSSRWPRSTSSLRRTCSFTRQVSSSSSMTPPYSIRIEPSKDFMNKESDFDPRNPDHLLAVCAATYGTSRFSDIPFQVALVYRMCLRCRSSGHVHLYDDGNGRALCQTCMHKLEGKRRLKDAKLLETERKRRVSRQRAKYLDSLAEVIRAAENVHADIKNTTPVGGLGPIPKARIEFRLQNGHSRPRIDYAPETKGQKASRSEGRLLSPYF